MLYQAYIPRYPLNQFLDVFIYYEGLEIPHAFDRFLPNGDTEILIDFHDTPQYIFDNDSLKKIQACRRVWASGVRTEPITIPSGNGSSMMVLAFKKGMAGAFFPFPMDEIADSVVDADLIWGNDFGFLRERLLETEGISERFHLVEEFLLAKFNARLEINPCIAFAVNEMFRRPDRLSIARMNQKIGYSQKHFTQMFRRYVGITPKAYLRIMRFQKVIERVGTDAGIDWAFIANEYGFYDQSHFINDFKRLSGFTPDRYLETNRGLLNYIPMG